MTATPTATRLRRLVPPALAGVLLTLALTGCFKVDMDLAILGDTVSGTAIMAVDRQVVEMSGTDPQDLIGEASSGFDVEGVTSEPYDEGRWVGARYRFDRVSLDDFNGEGSGGLQILHDEAAGTYEVIGEMDLSGDLGLDEDAAGEVPGLDPTAMLQSIEVQIALTFPGSVISHNGQLDGTTVTWQPPPGEVTELRAVANDGSGSSTTTSVVVGAIAAAVLALGIGAAVWVVRRRRRTGAAVAPTTGFGDAPSAQEGFGAAPGGQAGFGAAPGQQGFGPAPGGAAGGAEEPTRQFGPAPGGQEGFGPAPGGAASGDEEPTRQFGPPPGGQEGLGQAPADRPEEPTQRLGHAPGGDEPEPR